MAGYTPPSYDSINLVITSEGGIAYTSPSYDNTNLVILSAYAPSSYDNINLIILTAYTPPSYDSIDLVIDVPEVSQGFTAYYGETLVINAYIGSIQIVNMILEP